MGSRIQFVGDGIDGGEGLRPLWSKEVETDEMNSLPKSETPEAGLRLPLQRARKAVLWSPCSSSLREVHWHLLPRGSPCRQPYPLGRPHSGVISLKLQSICYFPASDPSVVQGTMGVSVSHCERSVWGGR